MPTGEQRAIWAAIRAAPDDDTPRLVYADWLEDHGDPDRAEFIRVQVRLAQFGPDRRKGRKERPHLESREAALLAAHADGWLAPFRELFRGADPHDVYESWAKNRLRLCRGFAWVPDLSFAQARRVVAAGDDLEPLGPVWVSDMPVNYDHAAVVAVCGWPGAGCVTGLSAPGATDADAAAVVGSVALHNLMSLSLTRGSLTDAGAAAVAGWAGVARLRWLDLGHNPLTDATAVALADSPYLGPHTKLALENTSIGPAGAARLRGRFGDAVRLGS